MKKVKILIAENMQTIALQLKQHIMETYGEYIDVINITGSCGIAKRRLSNENYHAVVWDIHLDDGLCLTLIDVIKIKMPIVLMFTEIKGIIETLALQHYVDFSKLQIEKISETDKHEIGSEIEIAGISKTNPYSDDGLKIIKSFIDRAVRKANPIEISFFNYNNISIPLSLYNIAMITKPTGFVRIKDKNDAEVSMYAELKHRKVIFLNDGHIFITSTSKSYKSIDEIRKNILNENSARFLFINDILINYDNCRIDFSIVTGNIDIIVLFNHGFQDLHFENNFVESLNQYEYRLSFIPTDLEYSYVRTELEKKRLI